jgi:hypothetical protein
MDFTFSNSLKFQSTRYNGTVCGARIASHSHAARWPLLWRHAVIIRQRFQCHVYRCSATFCSRSVTRAYPSCQCQNQKRKVDFECRAFKAEWSVNYFATELDNKALCLLCNDTIAVLKYYNIRRHYQTNTRHNIPNSQESNDQKNWKH